MGYAARNSGLKCLQWLFRGIQLICSVVVMGIYAYFLATMVNHNMIVSTSTKAVLGIAVIGTIYTLIGISLVCCLAGHIGTSFIAMVIDTGLTGGYIYVAVHNRDGASSCAGATVGSPYGTGDASAAPASSQGEIVGLPRYGVACRLESACLAAACVAIIFLLLSILLEVCMNRNRTRANRPPRYADGYHYGAPPPPPAQQQQQQQRQRQGGLRGLMAGALPFHRTQSVRGDPDALPRHQQPSQFVTVREEPTWGEVQSLHDSDRLFLNDPRGGGDDDDDDDGVPVRFNSTTAPRPAADSYNEGEHVGGREYNLYRQDARGNDLSKTGTGRRGDRETKAARVERLTAS